MKKFLSITTVLFATLICFADSVYITLTWKNNPSLDLVSKYKIYQSIPPSTNFVAIATVTGTNVAVVKVFNGGAFAVSAINSVGESGLSQNIWYPTNSPSIPTGISLTATNR